LEAACGTGRAWFDAAEELALRALDASDLDVQVFDADVDALSGLGASAALAESNHLMELVAQSGFARRGSPWHISMLGETPQRAVNALASIELQKTYRPCALWWTQGSEAVQPGWLVTSGLPTPAGYVAMLSGQWLAAGWNSVELATQPPVQAATVSEATETEVPQPVDLRIIAAHPPSRHGLRASVETRYITRPEAGLWGIVMAADGGDPGARADLIADVAHDLPPQATLTAGIESARRALHRVLAPATAAGAGAFAGKQGALAVILFLAQGAECAVVWSGAAQAVRLRGGKTKELLEGEQQVSADATVDAPAAPWLDRDGAGADDGGLLALLSTPATPEPAISVRYEELQAHDLWVLGIDGSIPDTLLDEACDPSAAHGSQSLLDSILAKHAPATAAAAAPPPLMLIAAQPAEPTGA
ncbi:MAG: hypothetical protein KGJ72_01510, partial [Gammaproteobacteria bacterium]|nr:hypothetical protein [Gammaproteobacteria bacterium]